MNASDDFIRSRAVRKGVEDGVEWAVLFPEGVFFLTGYVRLPEGHPLRQYGDDYEKINEAYDLDAPGWLTYANGDWIGFDTGHLQVDRWTADDLAEVGVVPPWMENLLNLIGEWAEGNFTIHWSVGLIEDHCRALARRVAALVPQTHEGRPPPHSESAAGGGI